MWTNPPNSYCESKYLFEFILQPLHLLMGGLLSNLTLETYVLDYYFFFLNYLHVLYSSYNMIKFRPEHSTFSSIERRNNMHVFPYGIDDIEDDLNDSNNLKKFSKKLTKKVDAAISFSPFGDNEIKLYLFICEAKKPNNNLNDYEKLVRTLHDCFNSLVIYFCKKSKGLTTKLIKLFKKLVLFGLHIYGNLLLSLYIFTVHLLSYHTNCL